MKVNSLRLGGKAIQCACLFNFILIIGSDYYITKKQSQVLGSMRSGASDHIYNTTEGVEKQCKYHYLHQGGHGFSVYKMAQRILKEL